MRTCIIMNPNAGSADAAEDVESRFHALGDCTVLLTTGPGHGEELARSAVSKGFERIIAAGGDGTVNEVLNGIAPDFERVQFGILPLGTGNDFVRNLGIPLGDAAAAVAALATGAVRPVDLVHAEFPHDRYFLNTAGAGFTAKVGEKIDSSIKSFWGGIAYVWAAAKTIPELDEYQLDLVLDGERLRMPAYTVIVANGSTIGGGIPICPSARIDDGKLDVFILPVMPLTQLAILLPGILAGTPDADAVVCRQAAGIEINCSPPMPFNLDGEPFGDTPVRLRAVHRGLHMLSNPNSPPFPA